MIIKIIRGKKIITSLEFLDPGSRNLKYKPVQSRKVMNNYFNFNIYSLKVLNNKLKINMVKLFHKRKYLVFNEETYLQNLSHTCYDYHQL